MGLPKLKIFSIYRNKFFLGNAFCFPVGSSVLVENSKSIALNQPISRLSDVTISGLDLVFDLHSVIVCLDSLEVVLDAE